MTSGDVLRYCSRALAGHRRRTVLSLLGVSIGVAAVVILCALGEGARRHLEEQFEFLGSNVMIVLPGKVETAGGIPGFGGVPNDLTLDDARALQRQVPEVVSVAPICLGNETASRGDRSRRIVILGTTREMEMVHQLRVQQGRFLPDGDLDRGDAVAVLGASLARELFPGEPAVGRVLRLGDWRVRVRGVLQERGVHLGFDIDEIAYVPVATAMKMFNRTSLFRVVMEIRSFADHREVKRAVLDLMTERHDEEDVTCITPDTVLSSVSSILGMLSLALAGIAAVSLTVAGVGIMNVMLVSVAERTEEIGLLKAIGARRRQILTIFLTESAFLATLGGVVGLAGGWLLTRAVVLLVPAFPAAAPWWAVVASLGVAVLVGVVFGLLPAARASSLDPVQALAGRSR